ncbi:MAG TPA: DUF2779 domain-containing protein [Gammaproteobacteria bacterium]|jgi:hypothetical protein|nr:DUF2779 domain-containing protein [Gammaproteobacteria bacterium]
MNQRYLTKSKFVLATECPTKLYYIGKDDYSNLKSEDSFLEGLAENGYQVAELARCYHPEGILIEEENNLNAIAKTNELLKRDQVIIFEAAFSYQNLFVRADIVIKNGNSIKLIEVKSKSYDPFEESPFMTKKGGIYSEWQPYIYDIAFQKYVIMKANPEMNIASYLMLADKSTICPSDGLNQKFRIVKEMDRVKITLTSKLTTDEIDNPILKKINVDAEINHVFDKEKFLKKYSFPEYILYLSEHYLNDIKIKPVPGTVCKKCEFKSDSTNILKSGFEECWQEVFSFDKKACESPMILDIWNFKSLNSMIHTGICKANQIHKSSINIKENIKPGLSTSERQWLQIEKMTNSDTSEYLDKDGLKNAMAKWHYPLHFIDFETVKPAIPFHKGEHPYHDIAFQFSHHVLDEAGRVEHVGQYLNTQIGKNPNLDFIRALKQQLDKDQGTIFRYATHENTYLNKIYQQILSSQENIPDKDELCIFIKSISESTKDSTEKWQGARNMVDLRELILRFYYDPLTNGSNSIKYVFPAVLTRSIFLQDKYSQPIYGAHDGIPSLNFTNMQWVRKQNETISDPYTLLPKLFQDIDISEKGLDLLFGDDKIKGGGTASIAYSRLQFCEMSEVERRELIIALLKYCELDTLAMVMIVEFWRDYMHRN